ncbi:hypothetical protein TNCV_1900991, partial [Trichonephila clavipes]
GITDGQMSKILNTMAMFGKPSLNLDSIIYFNEPREPDLMSSFLQPGSVAATKASRRTPSNSDNENEINDAAPVPNIIRNEEHHEQYTLLLRRTFQW